LKDEGLDDGSSIVLLSLVLGFNLVLRGEEETMARQKKKWQKLPEWERELEQEVIDRRELIRILERVRRKRPTIKTSHKGGAP
jgi:hypothetical protein